VEYREVALRSFSHLPLGLLAFLLLSVTPRPIDAVEIPKPVINIPRPNIPRPTINIPRPNVTVNVPRPTINVPRPAINVSRPTVTVPKVDVPKPHIAVTVPKVVPHPMVATPKLSSPKPAIAVIPPKLEVPHHTVGEPKVDVPKSAVVVTLPKGDIPDRSVHTHPLDTPKPTVAVTAPVPTGSASGAIGETPLGKQVGGPNAEPPKISNGGGKAIGAAITEAPPGKLVGGPNADGPKISNGGIKAVGGGTSTSGASGAAANGSDASTGNTKPAKLAAPLNSNNPSNSQTPSSNSVAKSSSGASQAPINGMKPASDNGATAKASLASSPIAMKVQSTAGTKTWVDPRDGTVWTCPSNCRYVSVDGKKVPDFSSDWNVGPVVSVNSPAQTMEGGNTSGGGGSTVPHSSADLVFGTNSPPAGQSQTPQSSAPVAVTTGGHGQDQCKTCVPGNVYSLADQPGAYKFLGAPGCGSGGPSCWQQVTVTQTVPTTPNVPNVGPINNGPCEYCPGGRFMPNVTVPRPELPVPDTTATAHSLNSPSGDPPPTAQAKNAPAGDDPPPTAQANNSNKNDSQQSEENSGKTDDQQTANNNKSDDQQTTDSSANARAQQMADTQSDDQPAGKPFTPGSTDDPNCVAGCYDPKVLNDVGIQPQFADGTPATPVQPNGAPLSDVPQSPFQGNSAVPGDPLPLPPEPGSNLFGAAKEMAGSLKDNASDTISGLTQKAQTFVSDNKADGLTAYSEARTGQSAINDPGGYAEKKDKEKLTDMTMDEFAGPRPTDPQDAKGYDHNKGTVGKEIDNIQDNAKEKWNQFTNLPSQMKQRTNDIKNAFTDKLNDWSEKFSNFKGQ
jgi:uncharacterized protein YjbJ (UPF0337 family)